MFPLAPELQDAGREYRKLIADNANAWEVTDPSYWKTDFKQKAFAFARTSALLSDADTAEIPTKSDYTDAEKDSCIWLKEFFENDVSLAETFLLPRPPTLRTIHPVYINVPICRDKLKVGWRVTSDRGVHSALPPGIHGRRLVFEWRRILARGTRQLREAEEADRQAFAWAMHDAFLFLRPFRDGNGRTARLMLQDIRRELGLLPVVFEVEHRIIHRARAKFFNTAIFGPILRQRFAIAV